MSLNSSNINNQKMADGIDDWALEAASLLHERMEKNSIKLGSPLQFTYLNGAIDEKKEPDPVIISLDDEKASETESIVSHPYVSDSDDDEEDYFKTTTDQFLFPTRMHSFVFRFPDFQVVECLMHKRDRMVWKCIRKVDDLPCVIIVAEDHLPHLQVNGVPREVRIMSHLKGLDNVVDILGWCSASRTRYCMLLKYYTNVDMVEASFENTHLISKMIKSILQGIQQMHSRKIVHRDLATHNIMWNPLDEKATIIDLDTASPMREKYFSIVGRDTYDAPEKSETIEQRKKVKQERKENKKKLSHYVIKKPRVKSYGPECDIYAAGVVLAMLLFNEEHSPEPDVLKKRIRKIIQKKRHKEFPELDLLVKMLSYHPKDRITVDAALQHPFLVNPPEADEFYTTMRMYLQKLHDGVPIDDDGHSESEDQDDDQNPQDDDDDDQNPQDDDDDDQHPQDDDEKSDD